MTSQETYRVLALKYRPQTLNDLKGQEVLTRSLEKMIADQKIPHAFLFHGIRGVGKTTTARIVAKALNCKGPDGTGNMTIHPCGVCPSCKALNEDRHLDVIEMDAASHTSVDDIRDVIEACRYKAVQGRFKIFIIDEVHMLSKSAFNALLKTLEEPPAHVKFIFATTELKKIPDTILSRCQRFDLKRMDMPLLISYLTEIAQKEGMNGEETAFRILAQAADGSMRDGLSLLDQAIALTRADNQITILTHSVRSMLGQADRTRLIELMDGLLHSKVDEALESTRSILSTGCEAQNLLTDILDILYALLTYKSQKFMPYMGFIDQQENHLKELSEAIPMSVLLQSWQVLMKGFEELKQSPLQNQTLEMILLRLCYVVPLACLDEPKQLSHHFEAHPTRDQKKNLIQSTYDDLLKLFQDKRELVLYGHLRHDVHLVSLKENHLIIRLTPSVPKTFLNELKTKLKTYTGQEWTVESSGEEGILTPAQKDEQNKQAQQERLITHPLVQTIITAFPNSTIHFD